MALLCPIFSNDVVDPILMVLHGIMQFDMATGADSDGDVLLVIDMMKGYSAIL